MKKLPHPKTVLNVQVILIYVIMAVVVVLCCQQLPEIAEFFKSYSDKMKAALPVR